MSTFTVTAVRGIPEVGKGDDLAAMIAEAGDLADGDVVVVSSKIVSKAEGRVLTGVDRDDAIDEETARVVAEWTTPRGRTRIAQTRHGFVLAAAGVDASNITPGSVVLLPEDPDASARRLRAGLLAHAGARVGVVITDTAGRPWRDGLTDFAVGAAGVIVRDDLRGRPDIHGNRLDVTVVAVADELAAATELVRTKLSQTPVAVVRGLPHLVTDDDGPGAAALVRPAEEDRFRLGTPEAMRAAVYARSDVDEFTGATVDRTAFRRAVAAAVTAPVPGRAAPPWRFVLVESASTRLRLHDAVLDAWVDDLRSDGLSEAEIADRTAATMPLRRAPHLIVPCVLVPSSGTRRADVERDAHLFATGAAVENLLVALAAEGLGASWWSAPLHNPDVVRDVLGLPATWVPSGAVVAGHPAGPPPEHPDRDVDDYLTTR